MKILVADDDAISNRILSETLTRWGHEVYTASDGTAAWKVLTQPDPPRFAILDWMMPGLSGLEVCQQIRTLTSQPYTYIMLLTGKTEKSDIVAGLQAGADDYLTKPYDPQELQVRIGVGQRILALESELLRTLDRLKQSDRNRNEFISTLTHDLRTPLAAERNALDIILASETQVSERAQNLLRSMHSNNSNLLKLVNQLLESFQSEEMEVRLQPEPIQLHPLVEECFLALNAMAAERKTTLVNQTSLTLPPVYADPNQIKRVITNLVSNAIANTPPESRVDIKAEKAGGFLKISVSDNGYGISSEILPNLFERYYCGAGLTRKLGSGLGLSICKKLVELNGGKIGADSVVGSGSVFHFTLPVFIDSPEQERQRDVSILLVAEQELTRLGLNLTLENLPDVAIVGMAESGRQAIALASELKPDAVLIDGSLTDMDSATATRLLKAAHPTAQVLSLNSTADLKIPGEALTSGVDNPVLKAIPQGKLKKAIEALSE